MAIEPFFLYNDSLLNIAYGDDVISFDDRGYQFGDGIYEVVRIYKGKFFMFEEHLNRFFRSCNEISIDIPWTVDEIKEKLFELVRLNNFRKDGYVYVSLTRGSAPRNHPFPENVKPNLLAYVKDVPRPVDLFHSGVKTLLTDDVRWLRCDIKSLNLLGNVMVKQKAIENGCYEAIQVRRFSEDEVTEGSASNFYVVVNGTVLTHPTDQLILSGITRMKILELCKKLNIPVEELTFSPDVIDMADECFLSSVTSEVMPITEILGTKFKKQEVGPITRLLQHAFKEEIDSI